VPDIFCSCAGNRVQRVNAVLIAVRSWELENGKFHRDFQIFDGAGSGRHFEPVVLDDGIREKIAGNFMEFGFIDAAWELDLDAFPDANPADAFESEMFHGFGGGGALRVEN
jgi:hypothetical protein